MNIPLLQQEKIVSKQVSINDDEFSKQSASRFGSILLKKYEINNEIIGKVKLPVAVSHDFLEKSVVGVQYNTGDKKVDEIYDTKATGRLTDYKQIFNGRRSKTVEVIKEHNFTISMTESGNIIYLGCKDGTIHVIDQRFAGKLKKRFVPHNGKDVYHLQVAQGFLVTLSCSQELIIWDVKHFMDSDKVEPEQVKVIEKVSSFELKTSNKNTTLYYCKDSAIYETPLVYGTKIKSGEISTRELERLENALYTHHTDEDKILFADKYENIYLLTKGEGEEGSEQAKLLIEKEAGI